MQFLWAEIAASRVIQTPCTVRRAQQQFFISISLRFVVLEEGPHKIKSFESVQSLLNGLRAAHERPLVRGKIIPGRLDGVFFCRALGQQQPLGEEPMLHADRQEPTSFNLDESPAALTVFPQIQCANTGGNP